MNTPRFIKVSCACAFLVLLVLIFTPVPNATIDNTYDVHDNIINVIEGSCNDIIFDLKNNKAMPYINRGLEQGLTIKELKSKLKGKNVHLKFVDHWTPLDFDKSHPTLAYIELTETGEVLFNNIITS